MKYTKIYAEILAQPRFRDVLKWSENDQQRLERVQVAITRLEQWDTERRKNREMIK